MKLKDSNFSHRSTYGLGNYRGKAFTTGCANSRKCYVKTEMFDLVTRDWIMAEDYPFAGSKFVKIIDFLH